MKTFISIIFCLTITSLSAQKYKNEISFGYDFGMHLLSESLFESFTNQCYSGECDEWRFDYGWMRGRYKYYFNERIISGIEINYYSAYKTSFFDEDQIVYGYKNFIVPVFVQYNYISREKFVLSSSIGVSEHFQFETDQETRTTKMNTFPLFYGELINATWTFKSQVQPYISIGLGPDLLSAGMTYRF